MTTVYQIIRILRMIRFVSLMNRLYATAIAAGGAIFPVSSISHACTLYVSRAPSQRQTPRCQSLTGC